MIRIVIVEDELLIRVGIKMIIENSNNDIQVVGAFSNADDTLNFFSHNTADILVTDIKLPAMNGIELIRSLKEKNIDMQFIILSCFAEFEYAREAYELGVDKYVLKHELKEEELIEIIQKVFAERNENIQHLSKHNPLDKELDKMLKYRIAILVVKDKAVKDKYNSGENIDYSILEKIVNEITALQNLSSTRLNSTNRIVCTFSYPKDTAEEEINMSLKTAYKSISTNLNNYFNADVYLSISKTFEYDQKREHQDISFDEIYKEQYVKTLRVADFVFYYNNPCIIDSNQFNIDGDSKIDLNISNDIFFAHDGMENIQKELSAYLKLCKEESVHPNHVRIQIDKYINKLISYVERISEIKIKNLFEEDSYPSYLIIENIIDAAELFKWIVNIIEKIHTAVVRSSDFTITKIKSYIDNNIGDDISLMKISNQCHMTPTYFCKYFKKFTGVTYINYLNNKRVDKAKEYLATTDHSISKIANLVGIDNANYFFRMFKKITNETASNYRKSTKM